MTTDTGRAVTPRPTRRVEIDHDVMRSARVRLGLNYSQLARYLTALGCKVSSARLGQIEHGGAPSPDLFPLLVRALGLTENELKR